MSHVDLHLHSDASDGIVSPTDVVRRAASLGLSGLSLTDHDTVEGLDEAAEEARLHDLRFLPGAELSANEPNRSVHILAFGIDRRDSGLLAFLRTLQEDRRRRARQMVEKLRALGVALTYDAVEEQCKQAAPTRAHVARALVAERLVPDIHAVFRLYLQRGRPAFVEKLPTPPSLVIDQVHRAGGVALLAHPGRTYGEPEITRWRADGLDGVEVLHPANPEDVRRLLASLSRRLGLLRSGGSDWHGPFSDRSEIGSQKVPLEWMEEIEQRAAAV